MKGQVSTELLIIIGVVLMIFVPILVLVYFKANDAPKQIELNQADLAVSRISSQANAVGSLGSDTTVRADIYVPKNTKFIETRTTANGGEIVMQIDTQYGTSDISSVVKYPIKNPQKIADINAGGGWIRLKITSVYEDNQAKLLIERET